MDKINAMEKLGLTSIEAKVYLELLKIGSTTSGPLIKKAELHRATVYDVLKRLTEKGLVNYIIKQKTKYFQSADPDRFIDIVFEEGEKLKSKRENTKKLVSELKKIKKAALSREQAHVFVGKKAVKSIYEMILQYKENWIFGSHGRAKQSLGPYFNQFRTRKNKLGIKSKLVVSERMRGTDISDPKWSEVRFLPKEFDNPTATLIFGDNVAIIVWTETPVGFFIESKEAVEAFRNYFDMLWKVGKK